MLILCLDVDLEEGREVLMLILCLDVDLEKGSEVLMAQMLSQTSLLNKEICAGWYSRFILVIFHSAMEEVWPSFLMKLTSSEGTHKA